MSNLFFAPRAGAVLLCATEATQVWLGAEPAFNLLQQDFEQVVVALPAASDAARRAPAAFAAIRSISLKNKPPWEGVPDQQAALVIRISGATLSVPDAEKILDGANTGAKTGPGLQELQDGAPRASHSGALNGG
eukprot:6187449-Pleurochrysis_carterae.AAC.1